MVGHLLLDSATNFRHLLAFDEKSVLSCCSCSSLSTPYYDAQYIARRTGKKAPGKKIGCNRTNRSVPRNNPNNERIYRQRKVSEGHLDILPALKDGVSGDVGSDISAILTPFF
ncbi:MAG: hypothetical protein IKZ87_00435 [Actinomycetaceae bacterium]|nr:hypothetical protein [Actinomycetaceae bacterium]